MKIRKRYILLILIALLPLIHLVHPGDFCYGVTEIIVIGAFALLFVVVFLVVLFNNLYGIALKKELFNYRPVLIAVVYTIVLLFLLCFHDDNLFKTPKLAFKSPATSKTNVRLTLFTDKDFELKTLYKTYRCINKGTFTMQNDSIYLKFNNRYTQNNDIDSVYYFNRIRGVLQATTINNTILYQVTDLSKKEEYKYFSK